MINPYPERLVAFALPVVGGTRGQGEPAEAVRLARGVAGSKKYVAPRPSVGVAVVGGVRVSGTVAHHHEGVQLSTVTRPVPTADTERVPQVEAVRRDHNAVTGERTPPLVRWGS